MTVRINLISGPRNISTALMYSFRSRSDTTVVDEPFFGAFLAETGVDHPGRQETLASMETDPGVVIENQILGEFDSPIVFFKNMGHHMVVFDDWSWLTETHNVFLTRRPVEVLASFTKNIPNPTLELTGFDGQVRLMRYLRKLGQTPPVIDSADVLRDPEAALRTLCKKLEIPWDSAMLSWESGPKPEDGAWASYWYDRVWKSTGFEPYQPTNPQVPEHLNGLLAECNRLYAELIA